MNSKILEKTTLLQFEKKMLDLLNGCVDFNNKRIISSPRAVGDIVQEVVGEKMTECFPKELVMNYNSSFARRAMEDVAFFDTDENYYIIDIKTHNKNTNFNMPNLTSVERLAKRYKDDKVFFIILLVEYITEEDKLKFEKVTFCPIENLQWSCLTIGALGWGQIQIANANRVEIDRSQTRKTWMLQLCDVLDMFYPKEIAKIEQRIKYFQDIREFWENR